jgi:AAA domain
MKSTLNGGSLGRPPRYSSVTARCGDAPSSCLAGVPNLSPRHLLPFMRWLPEPQASCRFRLSKISRPEFAEQTSSTRPCVPRAVSLPNGRRAHRHQRLRFSHKRPQSSMEGSASSFHKLIEPIAAMCLSCRSLKPWQIEVSLPKTYVDRLVFVDALIAGQHALRNIRKHESTGRAAFGSFWHSEKSDWNQLRIILEWVFRQTEAGLSTSFRKLFADIKDQVLITKLVEQLGERLAAAKAAIQKVLLELSIDCRPAFSIQEFEQIPLNDFNERFAEWLNAMEQLPGWTNYFYRARHGRENGLTSLIDVRESTGISANEAVECYDRIYFSQLFRDIVRSKPELAHFDGEVHDQHVTNFRQLDKERLTLAKYRTLIAHFEGMPAKNAGIGAAGIVKGEIERKRGHRTVRRLLKDAGSVVQAIKPVFMMSPLSIAQFLAPGAVEFDLLVIDEASQVQPVDALGAIARCKQIVVVGDSKQLPPTKFFTRLTSDIESAEEDEDNEPQIALPQDIESVLGLCRARGIPEKMLRWHYRSRHHSLIAVSNHEFYEDKLFIVPSPQSKNQELGLKFNLIPDGVFDAGASATNRVEAKAVCRGIINHARNHPDLSLGVAAFSIRQRQAILDELELLRRENSELESFFAAHPTKPFFVKNLENVQGDERDVIMVQRV